MMLKENSGRPPPRMSSRPRTPVGSLRIGTLPGLLAVSLMDLRAAIFFCLFIFTPSRLFRPKSKSLTGTPGHASCSRRAVRASPMNVTSSPSSWARRATSPLAISSLSSCAISAGHSSLPSALTCTGAQPAHFGVGQREGPRKKRPKTGDARQCSQRPAHFLDHPAKRPRVPFKRPFPHRLTSDETLGEIPHR